MTAKLEYTVPTGRWGRLPRARLAAGVALVAASWLAVPWTGSFTATRTIPIPSATASPRSAVSVSDASPPVRDEDSGLLARLDARSGSGEPSSVAAWPPVAVDPDRAESALNQKPDPNVPPPPEYYVVVSGDTLSGIAESLGVDEGKLASENQLGNVHALSIGQRLIVPLRPNAERRAQVASRGATLLPRMIWPAQGYISTYFGEVGAVWIGGHHTGLDIGAKEGDPILAAEAGRVVEAGWSTGHGYGNYVMIDHGMGYRTLYGHMSVIRVKAGDQVTRGQQIGDVGNTGVSFGPHLHFEVQSQGVPVDPLGFLP